MSREHKRWEARLLDNAAHTTVLHRRRRTVIGLTTLTVLLAMAGLVAHVQLGSWRLGYASYGAAIVSGVVVLSVLFSKRLRVTRHPRR